MHDRFPSSDPLNNHLSRHEILPAQHESALRAYYWSIDRIMKQSTGEEALPGVAARLLADHYDITDEEAERLLGVSAAELPLLSTYQDNDMRQINKEQLLLFPLLELGSYVDAVYEPAASAEWYTQVSAAILERTSGVHSADCLQSGAKGCAAAGSCPWRIVGDTLTRQAINPDFASVEYAVAPEHQRKIILAKLTAARASGLERVNEHAIGDIADFYRVLADTQVKPAPGASS